MLMISLCQYLWFRLSSISFHWHSLGLNVYVVTFKCLATLFSPSHRYDVLLDLQPSNCAFGNLPSDPCGSMLVQSPRSAFGRQLNYAGKTYTLSTGIQDFSMVVQDS